jgi:hypothetical protein
LLLVHRRLEALVELHQGLGLSAPDLTFGLLRLGPS